MDQFERAFGKQIMGIVGLTPRTKFQIDCVVKDVQKLQMILSNAGIPGTHVVRLEDVIVDSVQRKSWECVEGLPISLKYGRHGDKPAILVQRPDGTDTRFEELSGLLKLYVWQAIPALLRTIHTNLTLANSVDTGHDYVLPAEPMPFMPEGR